MFTLNSRTVRTVIIVNNSYDYEPIFIQLKLLNFELKLVVSFVCLDPCIGQPDGASWNMVENCQGYWTCMNGHSMPSCCGNQTRYVSGTGCTADTTCIEACPPKTSVLPCMSRHSVLTQLPVSVYSYLKSKFLFPICIYVYVYLMFLFAVNCETQADADPNYYLQNVSGSLLRRRCAPGTHYDSGSCGCSILITVAPSTGTYPSS